MLRRALEPAREDGHEGPRERALTDQAPEQVRNGEGDEERVGDARREDVGEDHVAHQAEHAAGQGGRADHARGAGYATDLVR